MKKILYCLTLAILPGIAHADGEPPLPRNTAELQSEVGKILHDYPIPGLGIAVISHGKAEWVGGLGMADPAKREPVTADTLFRIGSISKGFVALAALKLQEEGKLKLTDPVKKWVPEIAIDNPWDATDPIRLVHLMEHTSGLDDASLHAFEHNVPPASTKEALDFDSNRRARWRPGSRQAYSNVGPAIVAYVIEKITGQRFEDYVKQNFFTPLHMDTATYFEPTGVGFAGQYARDGITRLPYWDIIYRPAGSINASPRDMANYVLFYLQRGSVDGTSILHPASIERMERNETLPMAALGVKDGYGLYNYVSMENGFAFHGHNGGVEGSLSEIMYLPEADAGYAIMINSPRPWPLALIANLLQRYLTRDLKPAPPPPAASVAPDTAIHYRGFYRNISPQSEFTAGLAYIGMVSRLQLDAKGLTMRSPFVVGGDAPEWTADSAVTFRRKGLPEASLAFLPDEDDEVLIQFPMSTWRKVSAVSALMPFITAVLCLLLMASSVAFGLIWGARKLIRKLPAPGPLSVRALPLVASLCFFPMAGIYASVLTKCDPLGLGEPNLKSISVFLLGLGFGAASFAGIITAWRHREAAMNRAAYWHSALVSGFCAVAAAYLLYWRLIGVPTWMM